MQEQTYESVDIEEFYDSEKSDDHAYSTDIVVFTEEEVKVHRAFIGDTKTGKTSIILKIVNNTFNEHFS